MLESLAETLEKIKVIDQNGKYILWRKDGSAALCICMLSYTYRNRLTLICVCVCVCVCACVCVKRWGSTGIAFVHVQESLKKESCKYEFTPAKRKILFRWKWTWKYFEKHIQNSVKLKATQRFASHSILDVSKGGSSRLRCSLTKCVLRNIAEFTGKHLCQSLFLNKVADLRPATLLGNRLWHKCFPINFAKFLRTLF